MARKKLFGKIASAAKKASTALTKARVSVAKSIPHAPITPKRAKKRPESASSLFEANTPSQVKPTPRRQAKRLPPPLIVNTDEDIDENVTGRKHNINTENMDYLEQQMKSAEGFDTDADGDYEDADGDFENARGKARRQAKRAARKTRRKVRKTGRKAKRATRKKKRETRKTTRVAKRIERKNTRVAKRANKRIAKESDADNNLKRANTRLDDANVTIEPTENEEGETVEPMITKDDEVLTPEIISPVETSSETIEPEITPEGEVMQPELVQTRQEPTENEDGSMVVDGQNIAPEVSEGGEEYAPEVVDEEQGADGEPVYTVLKYKRKPAVRNANGEVIMPYRMADGSVVTTGEIYKSASGQIYKSANGEVEIRNAVRTYPDYKDFSANGDSFNVSGLTDKPWKKWLIVSGVVLAGYLLWEKYGKKA